MTDEKTALLKAFVENKEMFEAVREALLTGMIGTDFSKTNWVWSIDKKLSDAAYGREVKLTTKALEWINAGFSDIARLASSNPQPAPKNQAR